MAKPSNQIRDELKLEIIGFALLAFAILCLVGLFTEKTGAVGNFLVRVLKGTAGEGKYLLPVLIAFLGLKVMKERRRLRFSVKILGALALYLIILTLFHMQIPEKTIFVDGLNGLGGGIIGALLAFCLRKSFGIAGSYIILSSLAIMAILVITNISLYSFLKEIGQKLGLYTAGLKEQVISFIYTDVEEDERTLNNSEDKEGPMIFDCNVYQEQGAFSEPEDMVETEEVTLPRIKIFPEPFGESQKPKKKVKEDGPVSPGFMNPHLAENRNQEKFETDFDQITPPKEYSLPSLGLLARSLKLKNPRLNKDITENVRILEDTLESFGIKAKVTQVSRGPAITRYELQPAPGVKVSRITSLSDDLALRLSASGVRIEAPIPGKDAVGIEVPNKEISSVVMREILESSEFAQFPSKLAVGLGKDIAGNPIIADLSKMPHLLIAGATGSGKSVCMNTLIASILFKAKPDEVKFLMIDPKMVELTTFNSIPHLIAPVVTDPKKAASALRWVVSEMENRYSLFANSGVKDVIRYNSQMVARGEKPLPLVVVLIDELADLMMVAPADVEDAICRLAQMARAAGIHLVVATQRPSVDVITGLIKANIPSRISFAVSSQIDSRTILDMAGAEKLLGKGDMLFFPVGAPKPVRVQGAFMSDKEVEELVSFIKKQGKPEYQEVVAKMENRESSRDMEEDELLPDAVKIFIETGQASISMLQRRLRIGYSRAARLMDIMEQRGIVGGYEGSKPRSVLMTLEQYLNAFGE